MSNVLPLFDWLALSDGHLHCVVANEQLRARNDCVEAKGPDARHRNALSSRTRLCVIRDKPLMAGTTVRRHPVNYIPTGDNKIQTTVTMPRHRTELTALTSGHENATSWAILLLLFFSTEISRVSQKK